MTDVAQSHNSIYSQKVQVHLRGDPTGSFKTGAVCPEALLALPDVVVMRVSIGVGIRKALKMLADVKV